MSNNRLGLFLFVTVVTLVVGLWIWFDGHSSDWALGVVPAEVAPLPVLAAASDLSQEIGPGGNGDRMAIFGLSKAKRLQLIADGVRWRACPLDRDPDDVEHVFWARALLVARRWNVEQERLVEALRTRLKGKDCAYFSADPFTLEVVFWHDGEEPDYLLYLKHF